MSSLLATPPVSACCWEAAWAECPPAPVLPGPGTQACKQSMQGSAACASPPLACPEPPVCGHHRAGLDRQQGRLRCLCKASSDAALLLTRLLSCPPFPRSFIEWCRADTEVKSLVPGGEPCIHLSLQARAGHASLPRVQLGFASALGRAPVHQPPASCGCCLQFIV